MPLLLRQDVYHHNANRPYPTTGTLMVLLASALGKPATAYGMDLYQPESAARQPAEIALPHEMEAELVHLRRALEHAAGTLTIRGRCTRWL